MSGNLADQLQVWGFEDELIIFRDGSLGFGLEARPIDVTCWDSSAINSLAQRIDQFLNGLPSGTDIQFIQEIQSGNEKIVRDHIDLGKDAQSETAKTLAYERANKFYSLDKAGMLPCHKLKIFVRKKISRPLVSKPTLFSKKTNFPQIAEKELRRELDLMNRLLDDVKRGIESLGLTTTQIKSNDLVLLLYAQWNPTRPSDLKQYNQEDIRTSILFTDAALSERGFSLSDMHYRVLSLKILPEMTFASMAQVLRGLPFDSKLFLTIQVPDQQKEIESLQIQRRLAFSMARGKRSGVSDIESEAKLQDLEGLLSQMIAQGEKVFNMSLNVLLRAKDEAALESQVSHTLSKIRELSGAEAMEESLASFDIFSEISIPNARANERSKKIKTTNLSDFLPLYGPWLGHDTPSMLLRSRLGSLVAFDVFSGQLSNANQIISGGSGSGKSFLTNILLLQLLKENPKIVFVDIGGSYKKFCENLGGQYINSDFTINPFDLSPGETRPSDQKIKFLVGLVELMTKEEGHQRLPKIERAEIEEAIQRVYQGPKEFWRLSTLKDLLLAHGDIQIRRFGRTLGPWCGETPYGRFFDQSTKVDLHGSIICFDLKGLEEEELQAICLYIITDLIWREFQKDRIQKKILVFDECWRLLDGGGSDGPSPGATLIAELYRTIRKYRGSCIGISQNIDDFARSKVAAAILPNSAIKWILMQKGADQARLKEVLQLNDAEMGLISSLHQERGLYSEAFLMAQDQRAVVAIESTPLEYWIATTDPRDLSAIESEKVQSPQLGQTDLLKKLAEKYPRGISASEVKTA